MKVISSEQMASIETHAYQDGASEADFMEEAGSGIALVVHDYAEVHNTDRHAILICGRGNNAGDAYVAGLHLLHLEYQVTAYQLFPLSECSKLCQQQHHNFFQEGGRIYEIENVNELQLPSNGIIVDGIFGTGFHGKIQEFIASVIEKMNRSRLPIIAVDIPSGLDGNSGTAETAVIATETAFLGLPKTGFFLNDGWDHVGKLRYVDFGLPKQYIDEAGSDFDMLMIENVKPLLPPIKRSRHKYQAGYVVGMAGSPGMGGAALLSADAALHGGAGIVRLLHPEGMQTELTASAVEVIKFAYQPNQVDELTVLLNRASSNYIGPGLGRSPATFDLLRTLFPRLTKPVVIDADALYLIGLEDIALPSQVILTPHHGEMNHLLGLTEMPPFDQQYLDRCLDYAKQHRCTIVLKGGPTFILHPGAAIRVCPRGDPGMATAGSGDLLTGLLAALLAQGLSPLDAATVGVYIHAIAGEYAANELTSYCMTSSDILFHFPEGFSFFDIAP